MAKVVNLKDGAGGDRPPRDETPPKVKPAEPKKRTPTDKKLAAELASTYQGIGLAVMGVGNLRQDPGVIATGVAVVEHAEQASEAWLDLADQNPKVKAALKRFTEASAVGSLVMVHASMLIPLAASRGIIPGPLAAAAAAASNGGAATS